jgi:uncharacterized protein (DUF697 family)
MDTSVDLSSDSLSSDDFILKAAKELVKVMDQTADNILPQDIANIVKFHAKGATTAALASGLVPGVGGTAAVLISGGFIWSMYVRIGNKIDLPFKENLLKSLASGVATNLAAGALGGIAISSALSLIPGIGSAGSAALSGAICYALTLTSGYIYLKLLTQLFSKKIDFNNISEQSLKNMAESIVKSDDVKKAFKEAKEKFNKMKKQGQFN